MSNSNSLQTFAREAALNHCEWLPCSHPISLKVGKAELWSVHFWGHLPSSSAAEQPI